MKYQSIKQLRAVTKTQLIADGSYDFVGKRWFDRLLWRLLERRRAVEPHFGTVEIIEYRNLQSKDMLNAIAEAIDTVRRDGEPHKVIMGRDVFIDFTRNPDVHQVLSFEAGPFQEGQKVFGVPVTVVPWIEGWAVI